MWRTLAHLQRANKLSPARLPDSLFVLTSALRNRLRYIFGKSSRQQRDGALFEGFTHIRWQSEFFVHKRSPLTAFPPYSLPTVAKAATLKTHRLRSFSFASSMKFFVRWEARLNGPVRTGKFGNVANQGDDFSDTNLKRFCAVSILDSGTTATFSF